MFGEVHTDQARIALRTFVWDEPDDTPETSCHEEDIIDLIADLLHLADEEGLDAESILRQAKEHWDSEHGRE